MKFKTYPKEAAFAIEHVRNAALLAKQIQQEARSAAFTKEDKSPVTLADFTVQALIASALQEEFPKDVLVGEEESAELCTPEGQETLKKICAYVEKALPGKKLSAKKVCALIDHGKGDATKRFWTIDPIDGTKGFVRGDQFAVALALIDKKEVKVGVLGCPRLGSGGSLIISVRGEGAWQQPLDNKKAEWKRLKVSGRKKIEEAVLLRSYEKANASISEVSQLISQFGIKKGPVQMDSLAKYAVLAAGDADLMMRFPTERHPYEYIWDQAAGQIAIEEAGGRVTDLNGKALDYSQGRKLLANRGVLLSNGHLHAQILSAIKKL